MKIKRKNILVLLILLAIILIPTKTFAKTEAECRANSYKGQCAHMRIVSFICPNIYDDDFDSASVCVDSFIEDPSGFEKINEGDTVPYLYDEANNKATLILTVTYLDASEVEDKSIGFTASYQYDNDKLQLIYDDTDLYAYPCIGSSRKTPQWSMSSVFGQEIPREETVQVDPSNPMNDRIEPNASRGIVPVGIIKNMGSNSNTDYPIPYRNYLGPYSDYFVFKVRPTAAAGATEINFYDDSLEYAQFADAQPNSQSHQYITDEISSFILGSETTIDAPIENLVIWKSETDHTVYKFGTPGSNYPVSFDADTLSYDVYLPGNTTSIYINATTGEGGSVSGDIGTKVLSNGTASFSIIGTDSEGDTRTYIITYHVPSNILSNLSASPLKFYNSSNPEYELQFTALNQTYTIYLNPTQASSVTVSSTTFDSNGGLETKLNSTTKTAKTQVNTLSETITNISDGDVYSVTSYGADCFGAYNEALGSCEGKTYTITFNIIDRTLSAISVKDTTEEEYEYGVTGFNPNTKEYTVVVPNSVSGVTISSTPSDEIFTRTPADIESSINVGNNDFTIRARGQDISDTYTETYTVHVYKLSNDASITSFTSTNGTLSSSTDTTSGNVLNKEYTLTIGDTIPNTVFNIGVNDSEKAYIGSNTNDHGGNKSWTVSASTPYTATVNSESCKTEYQSLYNNVCSQTVLTVNARILSSDTSIDSVNVRNSESGSVNYTVQDKGDGNYSVTVPSNASSVYVSVIPTNPATQTVNGNGTVNLTGSAGSNVEQTVTVTAEDGTTTKDYKITIHKAGVDATLKSLSISDGTISTPFNKETPRYDAYIESNKSNTKVSAEATSPLAKLNGTAASNTDKITDDTWTFATNGNIYTITVYAESCMVTGDTCVNRTYEIEMTQKSSNSELTTITVKSSDDSVTYGTINVVSGTSNYTVPLPEGVTDAKIEVTKGESSQTVSGDGNITGLTSGSNTQTIVSTSEYGEPYKSTYSVDLYVLTDDTSLTFTSSNGTLTVDASDSTKYTLSINDTVTNTRINSTANTKSYINTESTGNTLSETWNFASNGDTYSVTVYPERCKAAFNGGTACTTADGTTYTITRKEISTNATPSKIKVTSPDGGTTYGEIDFPASAPYNINVPAGTTDVKIVVEKGADDQTVTGDGDITGLTPGDNSNNVTLTAGDGTTTQTYPINIYVPHEENKLSSLTVSDGTLDQAFDPETKTYTLSISETVSTVTVTAAGDTGAYINSETTGNTLSDTWNLTNNNYSIKVFPERCKTEYNGGTACTDSDATTYTLTVNKLSNSKNITDLKVNDVTATQDGVDANNQPKYKVYLKPSDTSATFTCTASNNATCSGDALSTLADGSNSGTVKVTAEDGTEYDFNVEVYRVSDKIGLSALSFSDGSLKETLADGTYNYTGKFSTLKTSTSVTATPKYNGTINNLTTYTGIWTLSDPVSPYTFEVSSESCTSTFDSSITAECNRQTYTINYEAVSADATLRTISVKDQTGTEYFSETVGQNSYTIYVPSSVISYTVSATAESSSATVTITPNQPVTSVSDGANPVNTITVTPPVESGVGAEVYTITVYRLNDEAKLASLTTSLGTLSPSFNGSTTSYTLNLTSDLITSTNVSASATKDNALLTINGDTANKYTKEVTNNGWNLSNNTYTILVESESCAYPTVPNNSKCNRETYTITKNILSNEVVLDGLTVQSGDLSQNYTLTPTFNSSTTTYSVELPNGETTAAITIDPGTTGITIKAQSINTGGTASIDSTNSNRINLSGLVTGDNLVTITLLAQNGITEGTYSITLHVDSSDNSLTNLTSSVGTLTKTDNENYKLTIPDGTTATETTFTATIPEGATIKMNGSEVTGRPATANWTFTDGGTYTIEVTAEDGTPQTYTVTCEVESPAASDDNSLTSLRSSVGTLTPGTSANDYLLTVPSGTSTTTLTATIPSTATITMGGNTVSTRPASADWRFNDGDTYTIVVTSESGIPATYTVTVDVEDAPEGSSSTLNNINVVKSGGSEAYTVFDPSFTPNSSVQRDYKVYVPYTTTSVDVRGIPTDSNATVQYSETNTGILLVLGDNNLTISVTAEDNSETTVYNLDIYRLSNNANLSSLSISAANFNETFDKDTLEYTAFINNSLPATTVTATTEYDKAYINNESNTSSTFTWNFNNGSDTEYSLTVYSESCASAYTSVEGNSCTPKTYKIKATFFADKITSDAYGLTLVNEQSLDVIRDVAVNTTASDLKGVQTDNPSSYLKVYYPDETTEVPDNEVLATGMVIKLIINSQEYDKRYIVVPGDTSGDGVVDIFDLLAVVDHILENAELQGPYFIAGDLVDDFGESDIFDILYIVDMILSE